jgi:excinuclease ABC subunit C
VILKRNSNALFLLQRVRDEAHRFAITHHRKLRSRQTLYSALDVSRCRWRTQTRTAACLRQRQKNRSGYLEELLQVPLMNQRIAKTILQACMIRCTEQHMSTAARARSDEAATRLHPSAGWLLRHWRCCSGKR